MWNLGLQPEILDRNNIITAKFFTLKMIHLTKIIKNFKTWFTFVASTTGASNLLMAEGYIRYCGQVRGQHVVYLTPKISA
jgi:hypothetical protein